MLNSRISVSRLYANKLEVLPNYINPAPLFSAPAVWVVLGSSGFTYT